MSEHPKDVIRSVKLLIGICTEDGIICGLPIQLKYDATKRLVDDLTVG